MSSLFSVFTGKSSSKEHEMKMKDTASLLPLQKSIDKMREELNVIQKIISSKNMKLENLLQQISRLRPNASHTPSDVRHHFGVLRYPDFLSFDVEDDAISVFNDVIKDYVLEIHKMKDLDKEMDKQIKKAEQDLHGCRLRSRTYQSLTDGGLAIPEYSAFIAEKSAGRSSSSPQRLQTSTLPTQSKSQPPSPQQSISKSNQSLLSRSVSLSNPHSSHSTQNFSSHSEELAQPQPPQHPQIQIISPTETQTIPSKNTDLNNLRPTNVNDTQEPI